MKTTNHILTLASLVTLVAASAAHAAEPAAEHRFITIADGSTMEVPIAGALNNLGQVAYITYRLEDFSPTAIRIGNGRTTTDILIPPGNASVEIGGLNDWGLLGLGILEFDPSTYDLIRSQAIVARRHQFTVLAETQPYIDRMMVGAPAVDNRGTAAFQLDRSELYQNSILTGRGAPFTIAAEAGPTQWVYGRAINNRNTVAYWKQGEDSADGLSGLYLWRNGMADRVFDAGSQPGEAAGPGIFHSFALNDLDSVAVETFVRRCPPVGIPGFCTLANSRILRLNQGVITTIATSTETFFPSGPVQLNNRGEVMFQGSDDQGNSAVYVGDGVRTRRVLGSGDMLLDRTVVFVTGHGLNIRGQVALTVQFSDDSSAVILATPYVGKCREGNR